MKAVCVVLHDVAPHNRASCERMLRHVASVGRAAAREIPVTLLVVPRMHGSEPEGEFITWLRSLRARGHELALHGYTHHDDAPAGRGLADYALRRWYTDGEGEFAALGRTQAQHRIDLGRAWAERHGLPMHGFVPPAWLLSNPARDAVVAAGFAYTCTLNQIIALPGGQRLTARSLVFSTRTAWRRVLSLGWNLALSRALRNAPLLRLELHPADAEHPAILHAACRLLAAALRERTPLAMQKVAQRIADR